METAWGLLLHLGFNMWCDRDAPEWPVPHIAARPYMRFDDALYAELTAAMPAAGVNMLVLDLGEGVRWESRPEIGVKGAWPVDRVRAEVRRLRELGIEAIPKLNFSTSHDAWLGPYSRCVSTPPYYAACEALIREAIDLFDTPRLFHLGMDEESFDHQAHYAFAQVRQHELWWEDLGRLIGWVEAGGSRPWVWSDYAWRNPAAFYARMPRTVVQSNWYYEPQFHAGRNPADRGPLTYDRAYLAYNDLAAEGYEQLPTGSNHSSDTNFAATVEYADAIPPAGLIGFLHAPWRPTLPENRERLLEAIAQIGAARRAREGRAG